MVLTPPSEHHFRLVAQVGATDFVARYPSVSTGAALRAEIERAASFGLKLSVIEGYLPMNDVIHGAPQREAALEEICRLVAEMGRLGVETLCYNFMPHGDWTRTSFEVPARGGAVTSEFNAHALNAELAAGKRIEAEALWENLACFLNAVVPVAQAAGVQLAMHPDDPPLPELCGVPQIMHSRAHFEKLFQLAPAPANGMCVCAGTFGAAGEAVPSLIRHFGARVHYAHFRNIKGRVPHFVEPFHDDGDLDMAAIMRALQSIGFAGAMRPDHVPRLDGESGVADGYTMLGRLFAAGYMRGLMHAIQSEPAGLADLATG